MTVDLRMYEFCKKEMSTFFLIKILLLIPVLLVACSTVTPAKKPKQKVFSPKKTVRPIKLSTPKVTYLCEGIVSEKVLYTEADADGRRMQKCEKTILKTTDGKIIEFKNVLTGNWGTHKFHTVRKVYEHFALVDANGTETVSSMIVGFKNNEKFYIQPYEEPVFSPDKSKFFFFYNGFPDEMDAPPMSKVFFILNGDIIADLFVTYEGSFTECDPKVQCMQHTIQTGQLIVDRWATNNKISGVLCPYGIERPWDFDHKTCPQVTLEKVNGKWISSWKPIDRYKIEYQCSEGLLGQEDFTKRGKQEGCEFTIVTFVDGKTIRRKNFESNGNMFNSFHSAFENFLILEKLESEGAGLILIGMYGEHEMFHILSSESIIDGATNDNRVLFTGTDGFFDKRHYLFEIDSMQKVHNVFMITFGEEDVQCEGLNCWPYPHFQTTTISDLKFKDNDSIEALKCPRYENANEKCTAVKIEFDREQSKWLPHWD